MIVRQSMKRAQAVGTLAIILLCGLYSQSALGGEPAVADAPGHPAAAALSPFGIGSCYTNNRSAQANATWVPQIAAIGITNQRTCETGWSAVEPEEGKWAWDALDAQMSYLQAQHIDFGGILAGDRRS